MSTLDQWRSKNEIQDLYREWTTKDTVERVQLKKIDDLAVAYLVAHSENKTTPVMDKLKVMATDYVKEAWGDNATITFYDDKVVAWLNDSVNKTWDRCFVERFFQQKEMK